MNTPSCEGCGACCLHMGVPPFDEAGVEPTDDTDCEYEALPPNLKTEIDAFWEASAEGIAGKPCVWLDTETRRCKHYDHRPIVCVDFKPGNPICLEDRESELTTTNSETEP